MTCPLPEVMRGHLAGFIIERWDEREGGRGHRPGRAHHGHIIEVVALRSTCGAEGASTTEEGGTEAHPAQANEASTPGAAVG